MCIYKKFVNHRFLRLIVLLSFLFCLSFVFQVSADTASNPSKNDVVSKEGTSKAKTVNPKKIMIGGGVTVFVIVAIGIIFMYASQTGKQAEEKIGQLFETTLFEDVASALKGDLSISPERLRQILSSENMKNEEFSSVVRIEYDLSKIDPHLVRQTVLAAIDRNGTVAMKKVSREYPWEDLPRKVRSRRIPSS